MLGRRARAASLGLPSDTFNVFASVVAFTVGYSALFCAASVFSLFSLSTHTNPEPPSGWRRAIGDRHASTPVPEIGDRSSRTVYSPSQEGNGVTTYQSLKEVVVALPSYAWPHAGKIEQRIKTEIGNKVKMAATSLPTPHVVCIGTHWVLTSGAVSPPPLSIQDDAAVRRIVLKIIREESGD